MPDTANHYFGDVVPVVEHDEISPLAIKLTAISSLIVWFTVAASGRWIGFS